MKTSETTGELTKSITEAQKNPKMPKKNKVNPRFKTGYADLASILETILPMYAAHGVSIIQATDITDVGIILNTRVMKGNEWIESTYPVCQYADPQAQMSALTYAKRAALQCMGMICGDDDLDGEDSKDVKTNVAASSKINEQQADRLMTLIVETGSDPEKFASYFKIKRLVDLPATEFERAVASLEKKKVAA